MSPILSASLRRLGILLLAVALLSTLSCVLQPMDGARVADREQVIELSGFGIEPMAGIEVRSFDYRTGHWLPLAFTRTDPVPSPWSPDPGTSVVDTLHEWSVRTSVPMDQWRPVAFDGSRITWSAKLRATHEGHSMSTFDAVGQRCLVDRAGTPPPAGEDPVLWYANCATGTTVRLEARTASTEPPTLDWYATYDRARLVAAGGKRVLYYVTGYDCGACDYLEYNVHTDAAVRQVAFDSYVAVKYYIFDHDNDVCPAVDADGEGSTPTTCILTADGRLLETYVGAPWDPAVYADLLRRHAL